MYNVVMKIFFAIMLAASPLAASEWGAAEGAAAASLTCSRSDVSVIGGAPLLGMLAERDAASLPVALGGRLFLASVAFDAAWDVWFTLKPAAGLGAGAWKEDALAAGAVYVDHGLSVTVKETDGTVSLAAAGEKREIKVSELFDLFYRNSMKETFGGAVTYAVFRNLEPLTEEEGTVAMRVGDDGLYYYSLTPDKQIEAAPHWLLAVDGVLYGLRIDDSSLLFVSKKIDMARPVLQPERALRS